MGQPGRGRSGAGHSGCGFSTSAVLVAVRKPLAAGPVVCSFWSVPARIALVGDYRSEVLAHRAIPRALELASAGAPDGPSWDWVPTRAIRLAPHDLVGFSGIWLVPASPYENTDGALAAVRFARETRRPFLGTCGGFQHAMIEFARDVAGLRLADHEETNPAAETRLISRLACSLVEQSDALRFTAGSLIRAAYGTETAEEGYHCNFGLNDEFRAVLEQAGLRFTAFDAAGRIRAAELPVDVHPFFVGTLFQPERAALRETCPPLVRSFVHAATLAPAQRDRAV